MADLRNAPPVQAPPTIEDLGVQGALFLHALLCAQSERRRVAPTRKMAIDAMGVLREQGVIDLPSPAPRWEAEPGAEDTPLERLQWRYRWAAYGREGLIEALAEFLEAVPTDEDGVALRIGLWQQLVRAEAQHYFEFHLARVHLPTEWSSDADFLVSGTPLTLSLAQWRYCLWAAARHGGAMVAQRTHTEAAIRESMFDDAKRRAALIASGRWTTSGFEPRAGEPDTALVRSFLRCLARIGDAFYRQAPSAAPWRLPEVQ